MNVPVVLNGLALIIILVFISWFSIDMKEPYSKEVIKLYSEPYTRFFLYGGVYLLSLYNNIIAITVAIGLVLLHIDYVNLVV